MIKQIVKDLTPPLFIKVLRRFTNKVKWTGNYASWELAAKHSGGYDTQQIIDKVIASSLAVKNGEAEFERDSVLFYEPDNNWPLLAALFYVANNVESMHVTDFGGALGSTYYQYRKLLRSISTLRWGVVEQQNYVDAGKAQLTDPDLKFYYNIDDCLQEQAPSVLLLSSVLQYLPNPTQFVKNALKYNYQYICIDRTGFIKGTDHVITVQKISADIYEASYPAFFFNERIFLSLFQEKYTLVFDFNASDVTNIASTYYKGFLLKRK